MKHKLEYKIALWFLLIILVIIGCYVVAFRVIYVRQEQKMLGEESMNTLLSMRSSIESIVDSANNVSKIFLSDQEIQDSMKSGDIYGNLTAQSKIMQRVYAILQFNHEISSICLIDRRNQIFTISNNEDVMFWKIIPSKITWYEDVVLKDGGIVLSWNSDGISRKRKNDVMSLIRLYKDMNSFQDLGILSINIKASAFESVYDKIIDEKSEQIILIDEAGHIICTDGMSILRKDYLNQYLEQLDQSEDGLMKEVYENDGVRYLVSGTGIKEYGWRLVRAIPMDNKEDRIGIMTANISLILLSAFLIFLGAITVSKMIMDPIQKLLSSMRKAEEGNFVKVEGNSYLHEFDYLLCNYNIMIEKIEDLLIQSVEKQKMIRKIELDEMMEQMKPHFLYNTLDSVSALIILEESQKALLLVESLGDFFRKSVSKGKDILSIKEEISIVENYINIMKIRFEHLFEAEFHAEEECIHYMIPKLTLQPIVENAIHHGIRMREKDGKISIHSGIEGDYLHLMIWDNGKGMSEEIIQKIIKMEDDFKDKSFGLSGTIDRLRLLYGDSFHYKISSREFERTEISFFIHIDSLERKNDI